MRLTDLEPEWVNYVDAKRHRRFSDSHSHVAYFPGEEPSSAETVIEASGVAFLCPTCFVKNGGPVGTETVLCWFANKGVPPEEFPGPGRWTVTGTGFGDLTLSPSVNVDHEHWHGWIKNGEVT